MNVPRKTNLQRAQKIKQRTKKVGRGINKDRKRSGKDKAKSDKQSEDHLMNSLCGAKIDKTNSSKLFV